MTRTSDQESRVVFRSDRVFASNGEYFFDTREGTTLGPFASRELAEQAIQHYIDRMTDGESDAA